MHSSISLGKFGTFPANLLIGRPFNVTYEILEGDHAHTQLRMVLPSEINAEAFAELGRDGLRAKAL